MKRDIVAKRVIQVVACGFGLLGLFCVCLAAAFLVTGIWKAEWSLLFLSTPLFLALGGIEIAIAWQALRRFGPTAIRNVVGLFMYFAWSQLAWFPESSHHSEPRWQSDLLEAALVLGPLCLAFLLYRILSRKLVQMTRTAASGNDPRLGAHPHEGGSRPESE